MVNEAIAALAAYGLEKGLVGPGGEVFAVNRLLEALELDSFAAPERVPAMPLEEILRILLDDAAARGILAEDTAARRDLLDTKLMGCLTPPPAQVAGEFWARYAAGPEAATDFYYRFSQDTDYIRRYRMTKDVRWQTETPYGALDITINLAKPEKDPRDIAAAGAQKASGYPKCLLCRENEGYAGNLSHPARQNHRIIPLELDGRRWFLQYSPYVYYNEHCIVLDENHTPMRITDGTFRRLLDFTAQFPHYFVGSNADLPIVGGSILSHDHFQGGRFTFPMARAPREVSFPLRGFAGVDAATAAWPMSVIRLTAADPAALARAASFVTETWRGYTDEAAFVFAQTGGELHNTVTPIARRAGENFQMDLVLRNNIATEEHPLGVYHPHAGLHHIKKENIGLIEVMGLAVLPARLKGELAAVQRCILSGGDLRADAATASHADWAEGVLRRRPVTPETAEAILREEVGLVFLRVLEDAGVYKRTPAGQAAFGRFLEKLG